MSVTCFQIHFSKYFLDAGEYAETHTSGLGAAADMNRIRLKGTCRIRQFAAPSLRWCRVNFIPGQQKSRGASVFSKTQAERSRKKHAIIKARIMLGIEILK